MNLLQYRRKEKGLRQLDLARAADLRENYVCKIETNRVVPGPDIVRRLATALDCTPGEIGFVLDDDAKCVNG